jgi:putative MATE family efflux protein
VQVPEKPLQQVQEQELAADAAGLEPASSVGAGDGRLVRDRGKGGRGGSRAELPVTVASIMALALPTLVEQMFSAGIGFTDTIIAGHTGADEAARAAAVGAVGAMTYLQWFAGLMAGALGIGAMAIVSRAIGAGRPRMANRVAGTTCATAFLIGIGVAVLFFVAAPVLVWMFSLHGQAAAMGIAYLRIMCWTICFQTAGQIGMACLRGAGDTVRPMIVTAVITVVNAFASWALTFGKFGLPAWGIRGNATGTLLAFIVQGAVTFWFLVGGWAGLRLRPRHFRIVPHIVARVARIAVPSWLENLLLWGGQMAVVLLVMGRVDEVIGISGATLGAHTSVLRIESLAFLPGFGFGTACAALVGQYLGAGKPGEAVRATVLCNRLAVMTMTVSAVPMVVIPHWMLGWMVDSSKVVELGVIPLVIAGLAQPGFAVSIIKSSALKGAGETVWPMLATMTGMGSRVVLVVPTMLVLLKMGLGQWGLLAVWVCIFLDLNYRAVVMEVVFRKGKWKGKKLWGEEVKGFPVKS